MCILFCRTMGGVMYRRERHDMYASNQMYMILMDVHRAGLELANSSMKPLYITSPGSRHRILFNIGLDQYISDTTVPSIEPNPTQPRIQNARSAPGEPQTPTQGLLRRHRRNLQRLGRQIPARAPRPARQVPRALPRRAPPPRTRGRRAPAAGSRSRRRGCSSSAAAAASPSPRGCWRRRRARASPSTTSRRRSSGSRARTCSRRSPPPRRLPARPRRGRSPSASPSSRAT